MLNGGHPNLKNISVDSRNIKMISCISVHSSVQEYILERVWDTETGNYAGEKGLKNMLKHQDTFS